MLGFSKLEGEVCKGMMSKAKWFVVRKPSTGEIIATSANQIVPLKFLGLTKMLYYIHQTPFPLVVLKGGLGMRLLVPMIVSHPLIRN